MKLERIVILIFYMHDKVKSLFCSPFTWLFIVCILTFWQVTFLYSALHWDMLDVHLPWLTFMSYVLQSGELHYWNPYQQLGYPFHADMLSSWYPPSLLTARLIGFDLIVLHYYFTLHVFLAGCGMYKLITFFVNNKYISFLGAVSYMLCGVTVSNAQHLFIISSLTWTPFVIFYFLSANKTLAIIDILKLSVVFCLLITGGYPFLSVVTIYIIIILFLIIIIKRTVQNKNDILRISLLFISGAVLTTIICTPMIIGFIQVFPVLERGAPLSIESTISFPYTLNALLFSQIPFALANNWKYFGADISMINIYSGIIFSVFMIYGLSKKLTLMEYVFLGIGIVCLLGSLAKELPLMKWFAEYMPLFNFFRFPALFRLFFIIGLIVFASGSIRTFLSAYEQDKKRIVYIVILFIVIVVFVLLYSLLHIGIRNLSFWNHYDSFQKNLFALTLYQRLFIGGMLQLMLLLLLLFTLIKTKNKQMFLRYTLILVVFDMFMAVQMNMNFTVVDAQIDPVTTNQRLQTIIPNDYPVPKKTSMLHAKNEGTGILGIWRNVNNFTKKPAMDGFSSFWLNDYLKLEKDTMLNKNVLDNPIVYLSASAYPLETLSLHKASNVIKNENIYFDKEEYKLLKSLKLSHTDGDTAYFLEFRPNRFIVKAISSENQLLTLLQSAYKGWQVKINGEKTNWYKSNYLFMSVIIPKGESTIEFKYENELVKKGFYVAMFVFFAILISIVFFAISARKNRIN